MCLHIPRRLGQRMRMRIESSDRVIEVVGNIYGSEMEDGKVSIVVCINPGLCDAACMHVIQ